jgi:hypothetical protein
MQLFRCAARESFDNKRRHNGLPDRRYGRRSRTILAQLATEWLIKAAT